MKKRKPLKPYVKALLLLASILFLGLLWYLGADFYGIPFILPSPVSVITEFGKLLTTALFWKSLLFSALRILCGAVIGCLLGFLLGLLAGFSQIASTLFSPVVSVVRATPVACFIILAWVFIGPENLPIFISALMVVPILYTATALGIRETSVELLEAAYAYRLTSLQTAKVCYLPSLRPHLHNALFNSIGLAWKAGLAAEIIVHTEVSLGYEIWNAKAWEQNSAVLFAWTLAVICVSLCLETAFRLLSRRKEKRHV